MVQVRLWTILGEAQTGKSRTVRELASLPERGAPSFKDVFLRGGGYLRIYAKRMAWQEDRKTPDESIDEINRKIAAIARRPNGAPFAINILSTLRFDAIRHQSPALTCPSGAEYLRAWAGVGWSLEALVLMSPDRGGARDFFGDFGAPTAWIYDSRKMPLSEMVGSVRNHFGWA